MIYRIVCDGVDIFGDTVETAVLNPHLEIELNSAGSLEFTIPPENEDPWSFIDVFQNEIEVWENGEIIWFGRPLQITRDWNNQKKVVCEGALAYFNDTMERTHEIFPNPQHTNTNVTFFNHLINSYNSQIEINDGGFVDGGKSFTVGEVTVPVVDVYRKTDYQTTMECLQQMCLDTNGGYFILRKVYTPEGETPYTRYIDWYELMPYGSSQDVEYGVNLLDYNHDVNGSDICTVLIPVGADDLLLNTLTNRDPNVEANRGVGHKLGSDEIWYQPGVEKYGRVLQMQSFNDYSEKSMLWLKARDWLVEKNTDIPTIEVNAADLHYIKEHASTKENFKVGMRVKVLSGPHDMDQYLIIYKLSLDLDSGVKKITLGTPPKKELTDIVAPSSGKGSTRGTGGAGNSGDSGSSGGGGGGAVYIPVTDVQVKYPDEDKYKSSVSKKVAKIDLSDISKVTDVQVGGTSVVDDQGVANIEESVSDVTVDGSSVVDENHIAVLSSPRVKGVTYNGIDVVDPTDGIAKIDQSLAVGTLSEVSWYERGYYESDNETSTVTVTEPGIYFAIFSILENFSSGNDGADYVNIETHPYYTNLSISGGRILYQQNLFEYTNNLGIKYIKGRLMVFENSSTTTVTFKGSNYYFDPIGPQDSAIRPTIPGVDKPANYEWYEFDQTLQRFVLSEDVYALNDKIYYDKRGDYDLVPSSMVTPFANPAANGWYESDQRGNSSVYILSEDTIADVEKHYYTKTYNYNRTYSNKIKHVFKLNNTDPNYLAFIRGISSEYDDLSGGGLISFGSMVPNDKNVYLIIAMSGYYYASTAPHMKVVDAYNNKYFDWMPDDAQHDADIFFSPNSVINSKSVMHIGDGTYNDTTGHYSSEFFNSSNIFIGEVGYYPFDKCLKDNISYILIDTGNNIHSNNDYPYIRGDHTQVLSFRLSQPAGVLDVQHNGTSVTDENGVAEIGDVAYISDVNNVQTTLQANFQAGVDSVYNACVSKGSTPASHSLTDVVNGILAIPQGGGGGMELGHSIAEEVYLPKTDAYSTLVAAVTVTTIAEENQT